MIGNLESTMQRIETAPVTSPIAVFRYDAKLYESVFASTVISRKLIELGHPGFIGSFDGWMAPSVVRNALMARDE